MIPRKTDFWPLDLFRDFGLYGVPVVTAATADALLLESGDYLLLESGDKLLLE